MLTNVEEYNKTKCAKYWPNEGSTNYAEFMVTHCSEKRYSGTIRFKPQLPSLELIFILIFCITNLQTIS